MLLFSQHRILEERSGALAVGVAGNNQHALESPDVADGFAGFGKIGPRFASFEVTLEVAIFNVRLTAQPERVSDLQDDKAAALRRVEDTGAIGERAGLIAEFADLIVVEIVDFDPAGIDVAQHHVGFAEAAEIAEAHDLPVKPHGAEGG